MVVEVSQPRRAARHARMRRIEFVDSRRCCVLGTGGRVGMSDVSAGTPLPPPLVRPRPPPFVAASSSSHISNVAGARRLTQRCGACRVLRRGEA